MEVHSKKRLHLISGRAHPELAEEVAQLLDVKLLDANLSEFANGEIYCKFSESVRGGDVFILQTHTGLGSMSINDTIMEHLIMVDAAERASAKRTTVVAPFYGYARQDRKASGREPITAKLIADQFRVAGASRMVSVDLHSSQVQGFFDGPWDHLVAMPVLCDALGQMADDLVVVSPDAGRVKVAERYAQRLDADLAIVHKRRLHNQKHAVEAREVVGEVAGRTCVLIDDMIDTGGTIVAAAELLTDKGAKSVIAATTHGVFSGPAIERLENSCIEKVVVTNTLPMRRRIDKIEVVSIAPLIAAAIRAVFEDASVSEIFGGGNFG
ncbi:MAG: ribose-phosphate diphosphokinase [Actinomycetota bacterium]